MPRLLADITPLRQSADYRRLWFGQTLANVGAMLTTTAVGLQVYDLTGSTWSVGLLGGFALAPVIIMGLYGGALVDAHDRRKVALAASCVMWLATFCIVAQAYLGLNSTWVLYGLVALQAAAASVSSPARSAIIPRLVSMELLPAANALGSMAFSLATLCGPLLGAVLVASIGYGPTYLIDAVAFTAALYALLRLPPMPPLLPDGQTQADRALAPKGWRSVVEGLGFLAGRRNLLMTFLTDMSAMILAFPRSAFPAVAAIILGGGKTTVGVLSACLAFGTILAMALSGPVGRVRRQGRGVVVSVAIWGLSIALTGLVLVVAGRTEPSTVIWWALIGAGIGLALAGAADAVSAVFRGTILQSATPDHLRGRLQGVFIVVVTGGPRLGDMVMGGASAWLGEGWAILAGGLACFAAVALAARWHRPFWHYDARHPVP
ncbi:MAG: MFS transporter [Bifidobacteriaceae bacterium]|jgi:MFS family permease|nr:MFS transporter [Bifidobacteriaceae bacterium]